MKEQDNDSGIDEGYEDYKLLGAQEQQQQQKLKQENGIIQKKLKILVINGKEPGEDGGDWAEAKALIENGTGHEAGFGFGHWQKPVPYGEDAWGPNVVWQEEKSMWDGCPLCYGKNGSVVAQLSTTEFDYKTLLHYAETANVVVLLNSDKLDQGLLGNKKLSDLLKYNKVISYGSGNTKFDGEYLQNKNSAKYVHLESQDGCENLLECIQQRVDTDSDSNFKEELKVKQMELIDSEKVDQLYGPIEKYAKEHGKGQKGFFNKVKKYAKNNPKKTGVAGFIITEELLGQLLLRRSILGTIFGYNSNPKEKDAKNVKDNKKDEKKSNKSVISGGLE